MDAADEWKPLATVYVVTMQAGLQDDQVVRGIYGRQLRPDRKITASL